MISKWFELKDKAISLRKDGKSIRDIEEKLGIPRSTLSGWLKNIKLTERQKKVLDRRWRNALVQARKGSLIWHHAEKKKRLELAEKEAQKTLSEVNTKDKSILELALSMLYLGEGSKTGGTTIGNSNPEILLFFVRGMEILYGFESNKVKCDLHLRADQGEIEIKKYWSKKLDIPLKNFTSTSFDKRTIGKKTYEHYKGVCILKYGNIAIQRKLVYLSRQFCEKIIKGG